MGSPAVQGTQGLPSGTDAGGALQEYANRMMKGQNDHDHAALGASNVSKKFSPQEASNAFSCWLDTQRDLSKRLSGPPGEDRQNALAEAQQKARQMGIKLGAANAAIWQHIQRAAAAAGSKGVFDHDAMCAANLPVGFGWSNKGSGIDSLLKGLESPTGGSGVDISGGRKGNPRPGAIQDTPNE